MDEKPRGEGRAMTTGPDPRHRRLVENMRKAAEAEGPRARAAEWRGRSERERYEVFVDLFRMSVLVGQQRPRPYVKPPLNFPRFSTKS